MNGQKHIINRQVLELTISERSRAQPIQNKASEIVKYELQPALDNLFSKLTTADEIIRIDKLIIDLGTISEDELEKVLVERSLMEIGNKIRRDKITGLLNKGKKPENGLSAHDNGEFTTYSKSKDLLEQFVYFLQSGHFPWWYKSNKSSTNHGSSQLDEIFAEVLKLENTVLKSSIVPLLSNPSVRKRLVFQFSYSQLDQLLKRIDGKLFESFFSMLQVLNSTVKSTQNKTELSKSFYKIALKYFSTEQELKNDDLKIGFVKDLLAVFFNKYSIKENENILIEILESIKSNESKNFSEVSNLTVVAVVQVAIELRTQNRVLHEVMRGILSKSGPVVKNLVEQHQNLIYKESFATPSISKPDTDKTSRHFLTDKIKGGKEIQDTKMEHNDKPFSFFSSNTTENAEGIFVSNAGLVLLHPFLRYFFDGVGLLDKELQFKSQSDVYKAIHLLQFIVSGEESIAETELTLNKILCGLDIYKPIPKSFQLSDEEKEECINLIVTVLERWNALKTTNPAALRDTYLQREGTLKQSGQSWNLIIERNSFDVMLEKLPWSISLIKLPWLSQILYVEW